MDDSKLAITSLNSETASQLNGQFSPGVNATVHFLSEAKLSTLYLKQFYGDYKHWREYKESFETAVHRQNIPKI